MVKGLYAIKLDAKTCSKCSKEYPVSDFFKHKQTKDGLHSWCKSCCKEGNEKSRQKKYSTFEGRITTFLRTCKNSAEKRGNEFSLTRQDLIDCWENQQGLCVYSGIEMTTQPALPTSVSVERIDSSIGYTPENTVLCCNHINRMKSDLSYDEFFTFCKAISEWLTDENGEMVNATKE